MKKLNLPPYEVKVKSIDDKVRIFDLLRKKYVLLTPEEWVRQHFLHFLIRYNDYPKALIKVESGLNYNNRLKRSDIIVYNRKGGVFMIVECKAPDKKINKKSLEQAGIYGKSLKPEYLCLTNGLQHLFWIMDYKAGKAEQIDDVPPALEI
ncbi:type I restriction enzyme HsdR N-terminal domain-containing protein [Bacteroidota bacterium]